MRNRRHALVIALLTSLAACSSQRLQDARAPGGETAVGTEATTSQAAAPTLDRRALSAGEHLVVRCDEGTPTLSPAAPQVAREGTSATFAPERAQAYLALCTTAGGPAGPSVRVVVQPGTPRTLRVHLPRAGALVAGAKLEARCVGLDAYGNEIEPPAADAASHGPSIFSVAGEQAQAAGRGTVQLPAQHIGEVPVRCHVPGWPHLPSSEPVMAQVRAAPVRVLVAEAGEGPMVVHTPVRVACIGLDADGVAQRVPEAQLRLLSPDAQLLDDGFSADRAGVYRIVCTLPGDDAGRSPLVSAPLEVRLSAGRPHHWTVNLYRQGACFSQDRRLPLTWNVFDAWDNAIEGVEAELSTEPKVEIGRDRSGGFVLPGEAAYALTLRAVGPGTEDLPAWHDRIVVDSTPPTLVIESPARASTIVSNDTTQALVGRVVDGHSAIVSLVVNGVPLDIAPGQTELAFEMPHQSRWGVNILEASAKDACGNVATLTQSYMRSSRYLPVAGESEHDGAGRVTQAMRAAFSQQMWDDGDPDSMHDVATLMQMALSSSSLEERLPQQLGAYPSGDENGELPLVQHHCLGMYTTQHKATGLELSRRGPLSYDAPEIQYLHAADGGWEVSFVLRRMRVPFSMTGFADFGCTSSTSATADGEVTSEAIEVRARVFVDIVDGEPTVTIAEDGVEVRFTDGAPKVHLEVPKLMRWVMHSSADTAISWATSLFKRRIESVLAHRARTELQSGMQNFLRGLQLRHSLPLPAPIETTLNIVSGVDHIDLQGPAGSGRGEFGLYTQMVAAGAPLAAPEGLPFVLPQPQRGPILRERTSRVPLLADAQESFALAVHDDLLNQMLWALWAGGAFVNDDIASVMGASEQAPSESNLLDAARVRVFFMAPPVIMPSESPDEVRIGIGDVYVEANLDTYSLFGAHPPMVAERLNAGFFFSTTLEARLELDPDNGALVVTPLRTPDIRMQVVKVQPAAMGEAVHHWLHKMLSRSVPRMLSTTLRAFPLPELQIGRIPGVPPEAVWVLDHGKLTRPAGGAETVLHGSVRGGTRPENG